MNYADWKEFLETIAPLKYAWPTDNPGHQMGHSKRKINRILLCLDCSPKVIKTAIDKQIDLIISFHPLFWPNRIKNLVTDEDKKTDYLMLKRAKIAVFSMHTNYENCFLSRELIAKFANQKQIQSKDLISTTILKPTKTIKQIIQECKKQFQINHLDYWCKTNLAVPVRKLGLVSGSGGHALANLKTSKLDLLITGDLKWHQWHKIVRDRQNTIVVGHHMEEFFISSLKKQISSHPIAKTVEIGAVYHGSLFHKI